MRNGLVSIVVLVLLVVFVPVRAQTIQQLSDSRTSRTSRPILDFSGSRVFALSSSDPIGQNPSHRWQLFMWDLATDSTHQLTDFREGIETYYSWYTPARVDSPAASDDGSIVVVSTRADPVGTNPDGSPELFLRQVDFPAWTQLTTATGDAMSLLGHYELSGDGSRVVFESNHDYVADVSSGSDGFEIYTMATDGTNLIQASTGLEGDSLWPSISDDGNRISFEDSTGLVVAQSDGTILSTSPISLDFPRISGDGDTVVYLQTGLGSNAGIILWDGTGARQLSFSNAVKYADISDDGSRVFYSEPQFHIYLFEQPNSSTPIIWNPSWSSADCSSVGASGDGKKVAFLCDSADPLGQNPDGSSELFVATDAGGSVVQLSDDSVSGDSTEPDIAEISGDIVFASTANPLGSDPHPGSQIYVRTALDGGLVQLTDLASGSARNPRISDDGRYVVFELHTQPGASIRLIDRNDGGETVLAEISDSASCPDIDADGDTVIARTNSDDLVRLPTDGSGPVPIVTGYGACPSLDGLGTSIASTKAGAVMVVSVDGSVESTVATNGSTPRISGDGRYVAFHTFTDLLGTNPDGNSEVYLYDRTELDTVQLTNFGFTSPSVNSYVSDISETGTWVHFRRQDRSGKLTGLYRVHTNSLVEERLDGLRPCALLSPTFNSDGSGERSVFAGVSDCAGDNPDRNGEIFLIDRTAPWTIRVEQTDAGSVVRWPTASGIEKYDLIRGNLENLSHLPTDRVGLGTVDCIRNDIRFPDSESYPDDLTPAPSAGFFYLVRREPGGSLGISDSFLPREAATGDCPQVLPPGS